MENKKIYAAFFILVALFSILGYAHQISKVALDGNSGDFGHYYFFSKALSLGHNIYALDAGAEDKLRQGFLMPRFVPGPSLHSPVFFTLLRGISFLKFAPAFWFWFILNQILLIGSLALILGLARDELSGLDKNFVFASSLFLVFSFWPLMEDVVNGQINILILFLLLAGVHLLKLRRDILAGIAFSLAAVIKPHFGIVLIFLLWKRCYRVFLAAVSFMFVLELASLAVNGKEVAIAYLGCFSGKVFASCAVNASMANFSLWALFNRLSGISVRPGLIPLVSVASMLVSIGLLSYTAYLTRGRRRGVNTDFILQLSLVISLLFIIFPVVHEHHYVILYLPIIFIWILLCREAKPLPLCLFSASFLMLGLGYSLRRFALFSSGPWSIFSGFKLYGVMVLFYLTAYMVKEEKLKGKG